MKSMRRFYAILIAFSLLIPTVLGVVHLGFVSVSTMYVWYTPESGGHAVQYPVGHSTEAASTGGHTHNPDDCSLCALLRVGKDFTVDTIAVQLCIFLGLCVLFCVVPERISVTPISLKVRMNW